MVFIDNVVRSVSEFFIVMRDLIRSFTLVDLLDVAIIAVLIYGVIKLAREARAGQLIKGLLLFVVLYFVSTTLNLNMLNSLLTNFIQFTFVAILIVFQPEIRKALEQMGRSNVGKSIVNAVSKDRSKSSESERICINNVVDALSILQKQRMGALIVFERSTKLGEIAQTGTVLNAKPSAELIANIFFNKAPLHDGSMIIREDFVYSAGCILPLTSNPSISPALGTRHRAGIGMSEESDAVVVILSEETGATSIAVNGNILENLSKDNLRSKLYEIILSHTEEDNGNQKGKISLIPKRRKGKKDGKE